MTAASAFPWRAILDPGWAPGDGQPAAPAPDAVRRFAGLMSPVLAAHLLQPVSAALGRDLVDPADVRQSRLLNRLAGASQRGAVERLTAAGVSFVCLKGFALAHTIYPDPDLRTVGDLDLLVPAAGLDRAIAALTEAEFSFGRLPRARWGFISDASFLPLVSADGVCSVDLHVEPDCYPAYRSLSADRLFAAATTASAGQVAFRVPCPEHALLLALTNAAKDKFAGIAVRKLVDAALLIRAHPALDWAEVRGLAEAGHFLRPAQVALALLVRLGLPETIVPADLRTVSGAVSRRVFARLVEDYRTVFAEEPSTVRTLARELAVCTEPDVALHNAMLRLRGLFRPATGLPPGWRERR